MITIIAIFTCIMISLRYSYRLGDEDVPQVSIYTRRGDQSC